MFINVHRYTEWGLRFFYIKILSIYCWLFTLYIKNGLASFWVDFFCFNAKCKISGFPSNNLKFFQIIDIISGNLSLHFHWHLVDYLYTTTNTTIAVCITYVTTLRFVFKFKGWGIESHIYGQYKEIMDNFNWNIWKNIAGIAVGDPLGFTI